MCDIHIDEITRASLCSRPGRISGHWSESQTYPHPGCGLVPPNGHCFLWFKFPWVQFRLLWRAPKQQWQYFLVNCLSFCGPDWNAYSRSYLDFRISLGEKSWNPFSFTLLLEMLSDMALPLLSFWSFTLALLQPMERETILYVYICVFI